MAKNVEKVDEVLEPVTEETEVKAPKAKKETKPGLYTQDKYIVNLPLTSEKQDDVTVGINGTLYKIKRGEPVEVSAAVYEVLMNMQNMDSLAIRRRNALMSK